MACAKERCMVRTCDLRFPVALTELTVPIAVTEYGGFRFVVNEIALQSVLASVPSSIEKGHVLHRLRLPFGVHHDPVPAVQRDRGVVGVPDAAPDVDAGIPPHGAPAPALRLRVAGHDALYCAR